MKKKAYYKLNRYQVTEVEVETEKQEKAVKMLNRDTDRFAKSEDTYRERCDSLDEMSEEKGYEPESDIPTPEEQLLASELKIAIAKGMDNLPKNRKSLCIKHFGKKRHYAKSAKKWVLTTRRFMNI